MTLVFITLGSNIEPEKYLPEAVWRLATETHLLRVSRVYKTAPVGSVGQADFLNAALLIESHTPPGVLKFGLLRPTETLLGRVRSEDTYAPRTMDLDIALYGDLVLDDSQNGLYLPHPDILTRAHVALPLADLDPAFVHPVTGETLTQIAARFEGAAGIVLTDMNIAFSG